MQNLYQAKRVRLLAARAAALVPGRAHGGRGRRAEGLRAEDLGGGIRAQGTPAPVRKQLNEGIAAAVQSPAVLKRFETFGFQAWPASAAELSQAREADSARFAEVVKKANISLD